MRGRWTGPFTYQGAIDWITMYQKGRTRLNIEPYVRLVIEDDFVGLGWPHSRDPKYFVEYHPDGRTKLYIEQRWKGIFNDIEQYTTIRNTPWRFKGYGSKLRLLDGADRSPKKLQRCRMCHGYDRQDVETEKILHELGCNEPPTKQVEYNWGSYSYMAQHHQFCQSLTHYQPCFRCEGTGKITTGGKPKEHPLGLDIKELWLTPEGVPILPKEEG